MQKSTTLFKLLFCIISISLFSTNCQKTSLDDASNISSEQQTQKITDWINAQKSKTDTAINKKLDSLITNLQFTNAHIEDIAEKEKVIIVPIRNSFKCNYNSTKNTSNCLLLIVNKLNKIRKGHIVQYQAPNNELTKEVPNGIFNTYYNLKDWNGTLTYLSLACKPIYEVEYKNNKLFKFSYASTDKDGKKQMTAKQSDGCTDWWLVTTIYWPNGEVEVHSEYLGRTCSQNEDFNTGDGDFTPGGEAETDIESEPKQWLVAEGVGGYWLVVSYEKFKGIKKASEPQGGHFTNITHLTSECITYSIPQTWHPMPTSTTVQPQLAKSSVGGTIKFTLDNEEIHIPYRTKTFSFTTIFP